MPSDPPQTVDAAQDLERFALAPGFLASAVACGLKPSGNLDLALIVADAPCDAAGMFTTNRVVAAPVLYDRGVLEQHPGAIRAVIANAGCANACTGERGLADARRMAELAAARVGCDPGQVLVLSTGVIGVPLDMEKLARGVTALPIPQPGGGAALAARAIMTTDTRPKVAGCDLSIAGRRVAIRGLAKGAGMIHPNMATMLAIVTTDARVAPAVLGEALSMAVSRSFNRISVDGDMSTNDTVLALASGAAGVEVDAAAFPAFAAALSEVCGSLARQIARDGEGASRLVEITISGARLESEAQRVADAIARSLLVKTAIHGGDPNWGRVMAAAGASDVPIEPERLALSFGRGAEAVRLVERGLPIPFDRKAAAARLRHDPVEIHLDLGLGGARATVWTCDLSAEYVTINAEYTT